MDKRLINQVKDFYSDLIFRRTYARYQDETWNHAVDRYYTYYAPLARKYGLLRKFDRAMELFKQKKILGSMRALSTAGYALHLYPETVYNCSYLNFNSWRDFADMLVLLMLGVGVGYSIERHTINKLPRRPSSFHKGDVTIVVGDSKEGWRDAFLTLLNTLQAGLIPEIDYSQIRPAGAPLKIFGGTASGSKPLQFLFDKTIELFISKPGKYWEPEDLFDLANLIANAVISGGVRRSACIALVDLEDAYKLKPKGFWESHPWRSYSNISITKHPGDWDKYIDYLKNEGTGEPGLFNRQGAKRQLEAVGRIPAADNLGINPCGEVLLRPYQFCNLVEVNVSEGTKDELLERVEAATLLAALQAVNINYQGVLGAGWKLNAKTEPLLGVSLTGLRMHDVLGYVWNEAEYWLILMRNKAHEIAEELGEKLNMKFTAVTTVKPSGTASQILGVTPGLHPAYSEYYIRRVRIHKDDPLLKKLQKYPLHFKPDIYNSNTIVMEFSFHVLNYQETTALSQLDYYLMLRKYWADHNPSATITVKEDEWNDVKNWLKWTYKDLIGITFLPETHSLVQAPYEEITQEEFEQRLKEWEPIFKNGQGLELNIHLPGQTNTTSFACGAGNCEVDEL